MKIAIGIGALVVILGAAAYFLWNPAGTSVNQGENSAVATGDRAAPAGSREVATGKYAVDSEASTVNWAGKKPLIDGYINTGAIALSSGSIDVNAETKTGTAEFTIDMNTISVGNTPTKPGKESTLEGHLKSERWFNTTEYPTATFSITKIAPQEGSETSFMYDVTGDLTLKGQTHELSFPAKIYLDQSGVLHAEASTEFDRTKWGLTSGSGSFFDDLADQVIDDMVALSFHLVATKQ